jgi:hypothetical protein
MTLVSYKWIDKTRHRGFLPDFKGIGKWLLRLSPPFLIAAALLIAPAYLAQSNTAFSYGTGTVAAATRAGIDEKRIEEQFGKSNLLVLLVPKGDMGTEAVISEELADIPNVTSVASYASSVGTGIPPKYLSKQIRDTFYSEHYARIILYTDMDTEGDAAFSTVGAVMDAAAEYYGSFYLAGQSATLFDMKKRRVGGHRRGKPLRGYRHRAGPAGYIQIAVHSAVFAVHHRNGHLGQSLAGLFLGPDPQLCRLSGYQHRAAGLHGGLCHPFFRPVSEQPEGNG